MKRAVAIGDLTDAPAERTHFVEHEAPLTKKRIAKTKPHALPSGAVRLVGAPVAASAATRATSSASIAHAVRGPSASPATSAAITPASLLAPTPDEMHRASTALPWIAGALGIVAVGAIAWAVYASQRRDDEMR